MLNISLCRHSGDHFKHLVSRKQEWLSAKEVASLLGKSDQYVRNAYEAGQILGHAMNGSALRGSEKRKTYQFHKEGILLFLLQTANYDSEAFMDTLKYILSNRSKDQLKELEEFIRVTSSNR